MTALLCEEMEKGERGVGCIRKKMKRGSKEREVVNWGEVTKIFTCAGSNVKHDLEYNRKAMHTTNHTVWLATLSLKSARLWRMAVWNVDVRM